MNGRVVNLRKSILFLLLALVVTLPFSNLSNIVSASELPDCKDGNCLEKPESNVTKKEYYQILGKVRQTADYKKLARETGLNRLSNKNIVINKEDNEVIVSFIMGEKSVMIIWHT